ncbi:MAG: C_GCAxxG_C_C family protein [Dehalococcoidales bacterium]|jgi:C_GCAxxG_C_C family probable redox protein|nr:C_GCAxxG_C_C family protein [Dehalococcoidales bacterium]
MGKPRGIITPEDKERLAQRAYELGYYHESHERNCSQSAVAAIMEALDFQDDSVFKASTPLAGGGAVFGDSGCGAYYGGLLIIGLLKGRSVDNFIAEETARFRSFEIGRALHRKFIDKYGTVICRDIMTKVYGRPFWMVDPYEFKRMEKAGGHTTVCPEVVGNGARWAIEVIFEENLLSELNELLKNTPPYTVK